MSANASPQAVVAVESQISAIVDEQLTYRGIPIEALFEQSSYEEVVFLLWFGRLPSASDLQGFRSRIASVAPISETTLDFVRRAAPGGPTRALEAGVVALGLDEPAPSANLGLPLRLLTGLPEIIAGFDRIRRGLDPIPAPMSDSIARRFLVAWHGAEPAPDIASALDRSLLLVADHELNAATFAARVAASTGADLVSVVLVALATQSGPLHGGSTERIGTLLAEVVDKGAERATAPLFANHERIPGFGHSVYRTGDPRALLFRQLLDELASGMDDRRFLDAAAELVALAEPRITQAPNLDLYAAACWSTLGIPADLFPSIFAMGRVAGWIAHIREQRADNRLIRPRARYIGRSKQAYVPIEQRTEWFEESEG